jgi:predicted methyltransferase
MTRTKFLVAALAAVALAGCATTSGGGHLGKPLKAADYAAILADPARPAADRADDAARKPAELLEFAQVRPGATVLEMEVGRGWMTEMLSKAVGPNGRVITQNPAEFTYSAPAMAARRKDGRLANVTDTTSHFDELKVPDHSVDEVLWILGPHETFFHPQGANLGDPAKSFQEIRRVLKPGGTLVVMDHAADAGAPPATTGQTLHRIDPAVAMKLATDAGFKLEAKSDLLANPNDDRTKPVFNSTIRRHTDQFLWRFKVK